jgi:hypothetical protein
MIRAANRTAETKIAVNAASLISFSRENHVHAEGHSKVFSYAAHIGNRRFINRAEEVSCYNHRCDTVSCFYTRSQPCRSAHSPGGHFAQQIRG